MDSDRVTTGSESVPMCWTALDDMFFTVVGDVLPTSFLWGAATLLASYDPDEPPADTHRPRPSGSDVGLPQQRSLDPHGRLRYDAA